MVWYCGREAQFPAWRLAGLVTPSCCGLYFTELQVWDGEERGNNHPTMLP